MKTRRYYSTPLALIMLALSSTTLSAVTIDGSKVTVDFDDFYSGTLLGYENSSVDRQLYSSDANYSPFTNGQGFELTIDSSGRCGTDVGALYDTDRRLYYSGGNYNSSTGEWTGGQQVTQYTALPGHDKNPVVQDGVRRDTDVYGNPALAGSGEDPDLEYDSTGGWNGGNLDGVRLNNALIIQEDTGISYWNGSVYNSPSAESRGHLYFVQGQHNWNHSGNWDKYAPDDEANGGTINFDFESTVDGFGFDFIDLDYNCYENPAHTTITFGDTSGNQFTIGFDEFMSGGDFDQTNEAGTVVWGNGNANRVDNITLSQVNDYISQNGGTQLNNFDQVTFDLSGSGAIATIRYNIATPVPEASTVISAGAIFLLIGFHFYRRRIKNKQ